MEPQRVERRLTTILSADVVGYSRLMGDEEAGTLAALKALRQELIDPKAKQYKGRTIKVMGDGALMEFASVVNAVTFAVDVQCTMRQRNVDVPQEKQITYRIGINIGDVIVEDDDIFGDGVNVAARLEGLAEPGGICVRRNVRNQVRDKLDLTFEDLGEIEVKNIVRPIRAFRVVLDQKASEFMTPVAQDIAKSRHPESPNPPLPDKPSIAILPFEPLGEDATTRNLAKGFAEDLATALTRLGSLFVIGCAATGAYQHRVIAPEEVGRKLGVRFLLNGNVEKADRRVRLNAQLIDAATGQQVWAERFDREVDDLFAVRDDVTLSVVSNLGVKLSRGEMDRLRRRESNDLEAWLLHSEGLSLMLRENPEDTHRAKELFQKAIDLDPGFVSAYANLGWANWHESRRKWSADPEDSLEMAMELAAKAVSIDDANGYAHALWAGIHLLRRAHDDAVAAGELSIALAPNAPSNHAVYGWVLMHAGQVDEAATHLETAIRLMPSYPSWFSFQHAHALVLAQRYEEAVTALSQFLTRDALPFNRVDAHLLLALSYAGIGQDERARAEIEQALASNPGITSAHFRERERLFHDLDAVEQRARRLELLGLRIDRRT